ncbi:hypothetical protein HMN09_00269100 [Mycena chlorophos]|uniref:CNNM transmembrane domain-containing protein n=1 Tax=Mycena chlorophos TaxID=658473 RepID=A0A8H6TPA7_MYCCL|nr:hypothetical protein HMN09_00269100 [Mycena chlorophos]
MNRLRRQSHATSDAGASSPPNAVATRPPVNGQPVISQTLRAALGLPLSTSEPELQPREVARPAFKSFATTNEAVHPRTRVEQYWAARAFAAETTLLGYEHGEVRRAKDQERHDARHAKLERVVLILLVLVATLLLGLLALAFSHSRSPSHHAKSPPAKHFTIPILSPFTSVIEHETSVVGSTTLAVIYKFHRQHSANPLKRILAMPTAALIANLAAVEDGGVEVTSNAFWEKMAASAVLVLLGGVFAGLTIALMGLDELHLKVLAASSEDLVEQANAKKVLALLHKGRHWVLVVLLLSNVIINESLPIFLDSAIGGGIAAVALSTTAIVIFGLATSLPQRCILRRFLTELSINLSLAKTAMIPQALSVRYGLRIGAACAPLVLTMMYLLAPVAYPMARLLDWVLGAEGAYTYKKTQLKSFLQLHRTGEDPLCDDEISILNGTLELGKKSVEQIMTPMRDVVTLAADAILDDKLLDFILNSGYSRFPVHEKGNTKAFIGLLLVKKLLRYDTSRACTVASLSLSILPEAHPGISCFQALDYFQTGRAHLLLISRTPGRPGGALGIVTLEDIIEEILAEEIVDETDWYGDNVTKQPARRTTTPAVMRGIIESPRSSFVSMPPDYSTFACEVPSSPIALANPKLDMNERTPLLELAETWQFLATGVDHIMNKLHEGLSFASYTSLYTTVYNYCMSTK